MKRAAAALLALALAVHACAPRTAPVVVLSSAGNAQVVELPAESTPTPAETAAWIGVVLDALKAAASIAAPIIEIVRGAK